jgi:repressor LexA
MKKLHPTQIKLLNLLKRNVIEPLTIRELQEELDISSTSVVFHHLQQLEKKGMIKRNPSNPGDYQILSDSDNQIVYLNLYGLAECGPNGRILDGNPVDRIPMPSKILGIPGDNAFLVKANGDSMSPKINHGDLVVAIRSNNAQSGAIVVCVNDNMALIKKIDFTNGKIFLHSINDSYMPFEANEENFFIEGIVKQVFNSL